MEAVGRRRPSTGRRTRTALAVRGTSIASGPRLGLGGLKEVKVEGPTGLVGLKERTEVVA